MAQAAYCSECGENVWVTPDGRCPKGHGPECLSNYFEAPGQPGAEQQPAAQQPVTTQPGTGMPQAPPPGESMPPASMAYAGAQAPKKSRTGLIIGIVLGVLLLCGVGVGVTMCVALNAAEDTVNEAISTIETPSTDLNTPQLGDDQTTGDDSTADITADAENMVYHFYPDFSLVDYALADESGDTETYHVLAQSDLAPGFYITFFADRTPGAPTSDIDESTQYYDSDADAVWDHPQTFVSGLVNLAGPDAISSDFLVDSIMTPFGEAHPDLNVTEFALNSNVQIVLRGITDDDLEAWYDDFTTFESVWEMGADGTWSETSFVQE